MKSIYLIDIKLKELEEKNTIRDLLRILGFVKIGMWFNSANMQVYVTYACIKPAHLEKKIKETFSEKIDDFTLRVINIDEFDEY